MAAKKAPKAIKNVQPKKKTVKSTAEKSMKMTKKCAYPKCGLSPPQSPETPYQLLDPDPDGIYRHFTPGPVRPPAPKPSYLDWINSGLDKDGHYVFVNPKDPSQTHIVLNQE
jgi:hypothetical protein